jgi:hypothetical protein
MTLVHFVNSKVDTSTSTTMTSSSTSRNYIFTTWGLLTMTSIVVSISAGRLTSYLECDGDPSSNMNEKFYIGEESDVDWQKMCDRTTFAIVIGSVGGFVSIMWIYFGRMVT